MSQSNKTSPNNEESTQPVLEGRVAVRAALDSGSREIAVIYLDRTRPDKRGHYARLAQRAADSGIPVEKVTPDVIAAQATGHSHGGVVAVVGPRRFVPLADLLPARADHAPFIAMIDGVEDPFNFGQAVRALFAAGADGVVVRPRNWTTAAAVVGRASGGASERIPMAVAETALEAAAFYREHGLTVATTAQRDSVPLYRADLTGPLFILIGGEKRGVTRSFLRQADLILEIPYGRRFDQSLGTAPATAVLAFEIMRQRLI